MDSWIEATAVGLTIEGTGTLPWNFSALITQPHSIGILISQWHRCTLFVSFMDYMDIDTKLVLGHTNTCCIHDDLPPCIQLIHACKSGLYEYLETKCEWTLLSPQLVDGFFWLYTYMNKLVGVVVWKLLWGRARGCWTRLTFLNQGLIKNPHSTMQSSLSALHSCYGSEFHYSALGCWQQNIHER